MKRNFPSALRPAPHSETCVRGDVSLDYCRQNSRTSRKSVIATLGLAKGKRTRSKTNMFSTGGQLYELVMGHDRFVPDLRPLLRPILKQRAFTCRLCCHPHDVCTELIAREAGALITSEKGDRLQAPWKQKCVGQGTRVLISRSWWNRCFTRPARLHGPLAVSGCSALNTWSTISLSLSAAAPCT
jgi:hypothetical protein